MISPKFLDDLAARFSQIAATSPVKDLEKNTRALLASLFSRLDLVTREEFEVQREILERTREKLTTLERQLAELEAQSGRSQPPSV